MSLKRGLQRESCDFCYRRKVKCDRSVRARHGLATCSQCALREEPCRLDDSGDVRIQRRRLLTARGGGVTDTGVRESCHTALMHTSVDDRDKPIASFAAASLFESARTEDVNAALLTHRDDLFADDLFELSLDSILFLDQVFMGDYGSTGWLRNQRPPTSTMGDGQVGHQESTSGHETLYQSSSLGGGSADSAAFTSALHCYFNLAALYLPVLLEDAFWQDYHAGRCSRSLIYAVACRGMPFTTAANKWDLQQDLACKFREAFLEARSTASDDGAIRLDDLEALALMIDFEYEDAGSPPLHLNLGRLFLKHDSLVLMTLQSRIPDRTITARADSQPAMLTKAGERRVLLSWHVYGLDAFHCLDRKQISHIPDNDAAGENEHLPPHEATDYFDAILALAIIARNIVRTLCSAASKRRGVKPSEVHILYEQLRHWKNNTCPRHLQRHEDSAGKLATIDLEGAKASAIQKRIQLHRAVLWALEINCILQIECCVSDYGIHDNSGGGNMEAEMTATRVEYESVRALHDMTNICLWMKQHCLRDGDDKLHSLVDLAPVVRNICAGLCFWSCQRGIDTAQRGGPTSYNTRADTSKGRDESDTKTRHKNSYTTTTQLLRDTVATATSHKDTAQVLERLDKQRALLETKLDDIQTINR